MKSMNRKTAGWLTILLLLAASAFSFAAMFQGSPKYLAGSATCLVISFFTLKQYLSSQSLS
ncbi:hypothetical protein IM774_09245 [Erysipelotrichaceae bacterium RD49]|nr:hypothetical protein [Erysipelotrichaceae bacterium RD49]